MNQAQYDAFDREVLIAPWMVAEMLRRAEAGARFAQSIQMNQHTTAHGTRLSPVARSCPLVHNRIQIAVTLSPNTRNGETKKRTP